MILPLHVQECLRTWVYRICTYVCMNACMYVYVHATKQSQVWVWESQKTQARVLIYASLCKYYFYTTKYKFYILAFFFWPNQRYLSLVPFLQFRPLSREWRWRRRPRVQYLESAEYKCWCGGGRMQAKQSTVLSSKVKTRLREPASWLPLAAGLSSSNLVFTF